MLLDIGTGILSAIFLSQVLPIHLTWGYVLAGIIFNLLPDTDFIFHIMQGGSSANAHQHRDHLHRPIPYILIGTLLISFVNIWSYALLFALTSLLHFIHDSIGIGWGVEWLWPFSKKHFAFFYLYKPKGREKLPRQLIYVFKHHEVEDIAKKFGDEHWIQNVYLKFHPYAIFEFVIFILSLFALLQNPPS